MKTLAAVVGLFTFSLLSSGAPPKAANDTQLPAAPSGYRWERFTEVQSAFLCPNGWHRFHKAGKSSHTYVLSVESVATNGSFETGMTVQAVKGLLDKKGMPPSVFALQMAQDTLEKKENRKLSSQDLSSGPFKAFGVRYRNEPAVAKPIIVHQVYIANDRKDTLFIVTLESPESTWDETWRIGERMLKLFLIDDEY